MHISNRSYPLSRVRHHEHHLPPLLLLALTAPLDHQPRHVVRLTLNQEYLISLIDDRGLHHTATGVVVDDPQAVLLGGRAAAGAAARAAAAAAAAAATALAAAAQDPGIQDAQEFGGCVAVNLLGGDEALDRGLLKLLVNVVGVLFLFIIVMPMFPIGS